MLMEAMQFEKSPMNIEIAISMKSQTIMMCREPEEIEISMVDFVSFQWTSVRDLGFLWVGSTFLWVVTGVCGLIP